MATSTKKTLAASEKTELLKKLKARFEKNMKRHPKVDWQEVEGRLSQSPGKLWSLQQMELTGGEPDVIGHDEKTGEYIIADCSAETPAGRRSLCYDDDALDSRKENKPAGSAMTVAATMGIELLDEEQYRALQKLGTFDAKTSSWLRTPDDIRNLGGAIFGDFRYGKVFIYHNGASSYYAARGFRGALRV